MTDALPRHINQSQLKVWRRCQREWWYKFGNSLVPRAKQRPLFLGSWVHACLETHYRDGDWKKGFLEYKKLYDGLFDEEREKLDRGRRKRGVGEPMPEMVKRIMRSYLWYYRNEEWEPVIVERVFEVQIADIIFKGRIDVAMKDADGRFWIWDHKTASTIPPASAFHAMDPQLMLYPEAAHRAFGMDVAGVLWNYVKSKAPTVPKLTRGGALSRSRISTDYPTAARFLKSEGFDLADFTDFLEPLKKRSDFLRRYKLPREPHVVKQILKEAVLTAREINTPKREGSYVRNITKDCGRCGYLPLCRAELEGGDARYIAKKYYKVEEEQPYIGISTTA